MTYTESPSMDKDASQNDGVGHVGVHPMEAHDEQSRRTHAAFSSTPKTLEQERMERRQHAHAQNSHPDSEGLALKLCVYLGVSTKLN